MDIIKVPDSSPTMRGSEIVGVCPGCGKKVVFEGVRSNDITTGDYILGQRRCPDNECRAHIFFVLKGSQLIRTYPPQRAPLDKAGVPQQITAAMEEAITSHAEQCYRAAAIMIRRTLEEICRDSGAAGDNLKDRIKALGDRIVIPKQLFEGMDELRLLGNDAAHVESRDYDTIGKDEVDVAIEFTKEVLKAVYQYAHLLRKLKGLRKDQSPGAMT